MTDLLNKYVKEHDAFIEALLKYYPLHEAFLERQSPRRTGDLRRALKEMRLTIKKLENAAQARMKERRVEWAEKYGLNKENEE